MRTDEMKLINDASISLVSVIRNLPFSGTQEEKQISQVLFLDKYFRENLTYEVGVLEIDDALMAGNNILVSELNNRYSYAFSNLGVFREKRVSAVGITEAASDILRRLGIQCNIVKGHITINSFTGNRVYPHQWNEIKIENVWYIYDFTFNLISSKHKNPEYKRVLQFIKMPITPVDYSFVNRNGKNVRIGGYTNPKRGPIERDLTLLVDDFSKYTTMDRSKVLSSYASIEKLYKAMNM